MSHTFVHLSFRDLAEGDIAVINSWLLDEYGNYPYLLTKEVIGKGICLVAVDVSDNSVVGFERGVPYHDYPGVFELCSLIVAPTYRFRGVAKRLTKACIDRMLKTGCRVMVSEPVANRPDCASQSTYLHFGFLMTAIQPCMHPGVKAELLGQPESLLLAATAVDDNSSLGRRQVYLPGRYAAVPKLLLPRQIRAREWSQTVNGEMPEVKIINAYRVGDWIGSEFIDIPANWRETSLVVDQAVSDGYRLAGFLPGFGLTESGEPYDFIRMYRPPQAVNFEVVHVAPFMSSLKAFMASDLGF